jgi:hypothetical protein
MHATIPSGSKLTADAFKFVHHDRLARRFDTTYSHLRLIDGLPDIRTYNDVLYTPARITPEGETGALFDSEGARIPASILMRGAAQVSPTTEPAMHARQEQVAEHPDTYLYLGWFQPHFGHFITETLARFWALREYVPGKLKILVHMPVPGMLNWPYVQEVLQGFGLSAEDIHSFDHSCVLKHVIVPDAALSLESHVFSGFRDSLVPLIEQGVNSTSSRSDQPVYFSRTRLRKGVYFYHGEDVLEARLKEQGVRILYPETMSVFEQIRVVNTHAHVIGIIGSGLHNSIFARSDLRVTYLTPRWVNPTCLLLDRCFDIDSTYVQVCDPSDVLRAQWARVRKRIPLLPKPRRKNRFHFERRLDMRLIDSWLKTTDL